MYIKQYSPAPLGTHFVMVTAQEVIIKQVPETFRCDRAAADDRSAFHITTRTTTASTTALTTILLLYINQDNQYFKRKKKNIGELND